MAREYNKLSWYVSGFKTQEAAEKELEDVLEWFKKTHDQMDWEVLSSVSKGPYGWKWELNAKKGDTIG